MREPHLSVRRVCAHLASARHRRVQRPSSFLPRGVVFLPRQDRALARAARPLSRAYVQVSLLICNARIQEYLPRSKSVPAVDPRSAQLRFVDSTQADIPERRHI